MRPALSFLALTLCAGMAFAWTPSPEKGGPLRLPSWAAEAQGLSPHVAGRLTLRVSREVLPAGRNLDPLQLDEVPEVRDLAEEYGLRGFRRLIEDSADLDQVARDSGLDLYYIIDLDRGLDLRRAIRRFTSLSEIDEAEPDYMVRISLVPTDTYYSQQWAHNNTGQADSWPYGYDVGTPDCDIDSPQAWDISTGSTDITIAIIDTGVDLDHPDLAAKIVAGYDWVNGDSVPQDDNDHGSACAGIAAAIGDNGTGVAGVDFNARIMPLKTLDQYGSGYTSDSAAAVNWARTHGADVISMSFGSDSYYSPMNTAINNANSAGIVCAGAAGNDNEASLDYPAAYSNCLSVGAISPCNERKNPSSCDGEYWWGSNYGTGLDVMAPGPLLYSTNSTGGYMTDMSGTSGATPHAAGVAALIKSVNNTLTANEIKDIIRNSCDDFDGGGWDSETGYGRLNAHQALLDTPGSNPCEDDYTGPAIVHTPLPDTEETAVPYPVEAEVTDECGVDHVDLNWRVDGGGWNTEAMVNSAGDTWESSIPAQPTGSFIEYELLAVDASPQANETSESHSFTILDPCDSDFEGPFLLHSPELQDTYDTVGPYAATFYISDECGLYSVSFVYRVDGGGWTGADINNIYDTTWLALIPGQPGGSFVEYQVTAIDNSPQYNVTQDSWSFNVLDACDSDVTGPAIVHTPLEDTEENAAPYPVTADVTDECGVDHVDLNWRVDGGGWTNDALVNTVGDTWDGSIPAQPTGSFIEYELVAVDGSPQANQTSESHSFTILDPCDSDTVEPTLVHDPLLEDTYDTVGPYDAYFTIADDCGLSEVTCRFRVDGGGWTGIAITNLFDDTWLVEIPGQPEGSFVEYEVTAVDDSPNLNTAQDMWSFNVLITPTLDPPVVQIEYLGANQVQLSWDPVQDATAYRVYESNAGYGTFVEILETTETSAIIDTAGDTQKYYTVTAVN